MAQYYLHGIPYMMCFSNQYCFGTLLIEYKKLLLLFALSVCSLEQEHKEI